MKGQKFNLTRRGIGINKIERKAVLSKLSPKTWYFFCLLEANYGREVYISKTKLAADLNISLPTLKKYLTIWESHGLIRQPPGGLVIAQLDGQESGVTVEPAVRKFRTAKDIIEYWCVLYEGKYRQTYGISNWGIATTQVKRLLAYSDAEIEGAFQAIFALYDSKWAKPNYPRPTLGAVCSWLFQQALPFANTHPKQPDVASQHPDLLRELEEKGWL